MRAGIPSGTSFLVAFARGLGVDEERLDPLASKLLPPPLAWLVRLPDRAGSARGQVQNALRRMTLGMVDHVVLRTKAIDHHLQQALGSGPRQVVILGAGMDARAWRLPWLETTTVYEVDHPSTQSFKRDRMRDATSIASVRYVATDFESERFIDRLRDAGFASDMPTVWIWEGVAMYLRTEAVHDSLSQLTEASVPGSHLLMTYRVPGSLPFGALGNVAVPAAFSALGEPLRAVFRPNELAGVLAPEWGVLQDQDPHDWRALGRSAARPSANFIGERLLVAHRRV